MSGLTTAARSILRASPVYFPLRQAFLGVFKREKFLSIRRARALYSEFIHAGDLIFDVGARVGDYAEIFLALKGRVLAIEPNPENANQLRKLQRFGPLHVEEVAVSDQEGSAELHLSQWDDIGTLSNEFIEVAKPYSGRACYSRSVRVRVTTLDKMAARYGIPSFS